MRICFTAISVAPDTLAELSGTIESTGYDVLSVAETRHDPFIGLTVAARATREMGLRTGIAVALARNPMTTAMLAYDLQLVSGGRFELGLGSQLKAHVERRFAMPWGQPVERMRDYVLALRAIWHSFTTGERLRHRGEFYRHTLLPPFFNPGPNPYGAPPILLGGVGERMTEMAGSVADGFIVHNVSSRKFLDEVTLPALRKGRESGGRSMDGFGIHVTPIVATGTNEETYRTAVRKARQQVAFYLATPTYATMLETHGLTELAADLHRLAAEGRADEMADAIDDAVLDTFAIAGEPKQVAAELVQRFGDVAASLSFYDPDVTDPGHWLPLYEELAAVREGGRT